MFANYLPGDWIILLSVCAIFVGACDSLVRAGGWFPRLGIPAVAWLIAGISGIIGALMLGKLLLPPFEVYL
ncbi:MAG: hypothetical protein OYK82_01515 [Gammaproteobacteria bacterium]|nr:hypothetical protein [Gammaproteobacteria bacterium]